MKEKYIKLLIEKCTELERGKALFIHYSIDSEEFVLSLVDEVRKRGITDIYLDKYDPVEVHDYLVEYSVSEIMRDSYFDCSVWDEYAGKGACFLILETEYPYVMDDIPADKIRAYARRKRETKRLYVKMVENCQLSWCIAAYPGVDWAEEVFGGVESFSMLEDAIYHICMVDQDDPIVCWEEQCSKVERITTYLNSLGLEKLVYRNSLGTDLEVYLPRGYIFSSARDRNIMVNMPSYEIFASPDYRRTRGVVYSSKPLVYNGVVIEDFWLKFEEGKVVSYGAKKGEDHLKGIIEADLQSGYLGECALVEKDSPIAKLGVTFGTTLIDENSSCHLALGSGFPECISSEELLGDEELLARGVNVSKVHVDFMVGTDDLNIIGVTSEGREVVIFEEGNFSSLIKEKCK